jgi:Protein of unknown function (DUF2586)
MGRLVGATVEKLQGGLGRLATGTDNHIALIAIGLPVGAVATAINNAGKGVVITSPYAAEQLGINESYDANNEITLYSDITEFFRLAPEATLYVFDKITSADLKGFINYNKEIKGYGFHLTYNSAAPNLVTTINAHQVIINALAAENRLIDFAIVGADGLDVFTQDLTALTAANVSVCIACSNPDGITALGAALGMLAVRKVNENIGSVNIQKKPLAKRGTLDYPLTDSTLNMWVEAWLSDGSNVEAIDKSVFDGIIAKGFIVAAAYQGYPGYFFSDSTTCIERTSDFAFIENNRTWNKAARIARTTLIPEVKGVVKKDPKSGYIASTTVARWKSLLEKAMEQMIINDEISGFETFINPKQVVNNTSPVQVKVTVVADGITHSFELAIGLANNI